VVRVIGSLLLSESDSLCPLSDSRGGDKIEQLNIVGKRSGEGFITHKAMLVQALSSALADRVTLMDIEIGRKGFLNYIKALAGSNMVKIVPANGSASEVQTAIKRLKVVCGNSIGYITNGDFMKTKTPFSYCEVKVHPYNSVKPNIGTTELAEALNRVLPFVSKSKDRPALSCVNFEAKEGKLNLVSADGYRLAVATLDYDDGEGQALVSWDELKGIASALRKARRARISFRSDEDSSIRLTIDTELIRYRWYGYNATYPNWQNYIPDKFEVTVHFDAIEALKALRLLKVIEYGAKSYPVDIVIGDGKMVLANAEDKAQVEVRADIDGEMYVRVDGAYLAQILKAFGGMVNLKLTNPASPVLFSQDGYQVVLMPIVSDKAKEYQAKATTTKSQPAEEAVAEAQQAEAEATSEETEEPADEEAEKPKRKRKAKEPVAVA